MIFSNYVAKTSGRGGLETWGLPIKIVFSLIFVWLASSPSLFAESCHTMCAEKDLKTLDSVVAKRDVYDAKKLEAIAKIKQRISIYISPQDQYNYYKQLYDEYLKFNADSAMHYAEKEKAVARQNNFEDLYLLAMIDEAYVVTLQGDMLKARNIMDKIGRIETVPQCARTKLAMLNLEFYMRAIQVGFYKPVMTQAYELYDKYSGYLPDNMWQKNYYGVMFLKLDKFSELTEELKKTKQPSPKAAMLCVAISRLCWTKKDIGNYLHYLILSAINDICSSNKEASSLLFLVSSPYSNLDTDRAFNYVMVCNENANAFKDVMRSVEVVNAHTKITRDYQRKLQQKTHFLYGVIGLLALAVVAILLLMRNVVKKRRKQDSLLKKLEQMNHSLETMVEKESVMKSKLEKSNGLLKREITYHNQNFINVYQLVTKYIAEVQEFRKMVYNLVTAGKYSKARQELLSNANSEKYLKNFFEHFDKAFLLSHPDFVTRFNALLKPGHEIIPQEKGTLTPELRIYALVSLGVTDSVSIAQFLHYSTQTVYNYRLKVRHSSCIPEKSFAETVAKMYENEA